MANQHEGNKTGNKKAATRSAKEKKALKKEKKVARQSVNETPIRHGPGK